MSSPIQVPMPQEAHRQWFRSGPGRSYNLTELGELIGPTYRIYEEQIRRCVSGLTKYAALCTAESRQDIYVPRLRELILEMASFWGLDGGLDKGVPARLEQRYGVTFDRAVAAARQSGAAPALTDQEKADILNGLEVHAQDMANTGDMEKWVAECRTMMVNMRDEWQMELDVPPQSTLTMEMNL